MKTAYKEYNFQILNKDESEILQNKITPKNKNSINFKKNILFINISDKILNVQNHYQFEGWAAIFSCEGKKIVYLRKSGERYNKISLKDILAAGGCIGLVVLTIWTLSAISDGFESLGK